MHYVLPALPEPPCPERELSAGDCEVKIIALEHQHWGLSSCLWGHSQGKAPSCANGGQGEQRMGCVDSSGDVGARWDPVGGHPHSNRASWLLAS